MSPFLVQGTGQEHCTQLHWSYIVFAALCLFEWADVDAALGKSCASYIYFLMQFLHWHITTES